MGGEGSGRKPSAENIVRRMNPPHVPVYDSLYIPNYSGVKEEALKKSTTDITGGGGGSTLWGSGANTIYPLSDQDISGAGIFVEGTVSGAIIYGESIFSGANAVSIEGHKHVEADITDLQAYALDSSYQTTSGSVITNTSNISTNTTNISTNSTNITTNSNDITNLSGSVAINTTDITNLSGSHATTYSELITVSGSHTVDTNDVLWASGANTIYPKSDQDISGAGLFIEGTISGADVQVSGDVSGAFLYGDGSNITNISVAGDGNPDLWASGANTIYPRSDQDISGAGLFIEGAISGSNLYGSSTISGGNAVVNKLITAQDRDTSGALYVANTVFVTSAETSGAVTASDYPEGTILVVYTA